MNESLPQDPYALLQAISSQLDSETRGQVAQILAQHEAVDQLAQRRREVLATIFNDLLGNVPAVSLCEEEADWTLLSAMGIFVFAGNKLNPRPLSKKNLERMIDYAEENADNEEYWTCKYWRIANERAKSLM